MTIEAPAHIAEFAAANGYEVLLVNDLLHNYLMGSELNPQLDDSFSRVVPQDKDTALERMATFASKNRPGFIHTMKDQKWPGSRRRPVALVFRPEAMALVKAEITRAPAEYQF